MTDVAFQIAKSFCMKLVDLFFRDRLFSDRKLDDAAHDRTFSTSRSRAIEALDVATGSSVSGWQPSAYV
jgi:hypothetical protein